MLTTAEYSIQTDSKTSHSNLFTFQHNRETSDLELTGYEENDVETRLLHLPRL